MFFSESSPTEVKSYSESFWTTREVLRRDGLAALSVDVEDLKRNSIPDGYEKE